MILTCASCATRYFADDASVGPEGRTVRCAACGHSWYVAPQLVLDRPADAPVATFLEGPASEGGLTREQIERTRQAAQPALSTAARARAKQAERQKKERVRQAAAAWGAAGAALALTAGAAVLLRQDIARLWPNAAGAYAAIGLPVNIVGLEFKQISVAKTVDGPTPMLVVSGAVRNITGAQKKPPVLRFSLRDDNGEELTHWMEELGGAALAPGAARPFRSSLDNPPAAAVDLEATFATPVEIAKESATRGRAPMAAAAGPKQALRVVDDNANPEGGPDEELTPPVPPSAYHDDGLAPRLSAPPVGPHG